MDLLKTLLLAHDALERAGVTHALIGAFALGALGVPRATADVDLLIDGERLAEARAALLGAGFSVFAESENVLQLSGAGAVDCLLARRAPTRAMLADAWIVPSLGVRCVRAEDLIGLKVQSYVNDPRRELKDQADIESLVRSGATIDWEKVKRHADLFDQWTIVEAIKTRAARR